MSNNGTYICYLGRDPEEMQLGGRDVVKLRLSNSTGKKHETRWFNAIVGGPDTDVAKQLKSGDQVAVAGQLNYTSWTPKKGKDAGKKQFGDEMPFAKLLQVLKSPTFFGTAEPPETTDAPAGTTEPDTTTPPDLSDLE